MGQPASPYQWKPAPSLLSPGTARAIHDALIDAERAEFEQRFAQEMAKAARTLDLVGVLTVLEVFHKVAEVTQREGANAHRRMLEQVARLQRGEKVPTVSGHIHKAEVNARLGRLPRVLVRDRP
ncbi:MAG TPA: DUF6247 family protein [Streptosporangiaceae bacterium]|nr:DUF6247 family protein [Streptosporangiaceae bacterium]